MRLLTRIGANRWRPWRGTYNNEDLSLKRILEPLDETSRESQVEFSMFI